MQNAHTNDVKEVNRANKLGRIPEIGDNHQVKEDKRKQSIKKEEEDQRTKGVENFCDSEESRIENKYKIIKIHIYINFLLCKRAVSAWHIIITHQKC